jgi:RNA recognition motif-containing protein
MDTEALTALFKDFKLTSAKVITDKWSGRSKGFGFVSVEGEEEQARVLDGMQNVEVEGRPLTIKIALATAENATAPQEDGEGEGVEQQ